MGTSSIRTNTFWNLIQDHRITIPAIQRDYAQGRSKDILDDKLQPRLDTCKKSLEALQPHDLGFIYGKVIPRTTPKTFIPIDGQQRLTFLFLIHWFAMVARSTLCDKEVEDTCERLSHFSYEVRQTSRDFFGVITRPTTVLDLRKQRLSDNGLVGSVSAYVRDSAWFLKEWSYDPTVASCLRVLDRIEKSFREKEDILDRLFEDTCPLRFEWLDIEGLGNEDELFIKMNSRGRLLTPFEYFKSELLNVVEASSTCGEAHIDQEFSKKLDIQWTNFFWKLGTEEDRINFDKRLMAFFHYALWDRRILQLHEKDRDKRLEKNETLKTYLKDTQDYVMSHFVDVTRDDGSDSDTEEKDGSWITREDVLTPLQRLLDYVCLDHGSEKETPGDEDDVYRIVKDVAESFTDNQRFGTREQRFRLQATLAYFSKKATFDAKSWKPWYRVINNIAKYAGGWQGFNTLDQFSHSLGVIKKLSEHIDDINEFLADSLWKMSAFGDLSDNLSKVLGEECRKAHLITLGVDWAEAIYQAEGIDEVMNGEQRFWQANAQTYLDGRIAFLLRCAGLWELSENGEQKEPSNGDHERLENYTSLFEHLFDKDGLRCDGSLFRLALLSIGDYSLSSRSEMQRFIIDDDSTHTQDWRRLFEDDEKRRKPLRLMQRLYDDEAYAMDSKALEELLKEIIASFNTERQNRQESSPLQNFFLKDRDSASAKELFDTFHDYNDNYYIKSFMFGKTDLFFVPYSKTESATARGLNHELRCFDLVCQLKGQGLELDSREPERTIRGVNSGGKLYRLKPIDYQGGLPFWLGVAPRSSGKPLAVWQGDSEECEVYTLEEFEEKFLLKETSED